MLKILLWPFFKKYLKLFFAIMLITAVAICAYTGLNGGYISLDTSLKTYIEDYQYADVTIITNPTAANIKKKLQTIEGVKAVDFRLVHDTQIRVDGMGLLTGRFFYCQPDGFQKLYVWEENIKEGEYNIDVDKKFAQYNNVSAGDYIEVNVNGEFQKVRIGRVVSSPECMVNVLDDYTLGESQEFGMFFVSAENNFFGEMYNKIANQFLLLVEPDYDQEEILNQAKDILSKRTDILSSWVYEQSPVKSKINVNVGGLKSLTTLVPSAFYITMLCVCSLFLVQIIRQSRKEIGILKSQGFKSSQIRLMFCTIAFFSELLGCVIGYFAGFGLSRYTCSLYLNYLLCPINITTINTKVSIISFVVTLAAGQISALIGTSLITGVKPSEALCPEVSFRTRIPAFFEKFPSRIKLSLVSLTRNTKNFIFSVICIAATIVLIFSSFEYELSKNKNIYEVYERRINHDCELLYNKPISEEDVALIKNLECVTDVEVMKYYSGVISFNGKEKSVKIQALPLDSTLMNIPGLGKSNIEVPSEGIVLESHIAKTLGATVGSIVQINGHDFEVASLSTQNTNRRIFMSTENAEILEDPARWVILCNCTSPEVVETAKDIDGFVNSTFTKYVQKYIVDAYFNHTIAVWLIIAFAILIGFTIVFNTTQTNLYYMKKEISVMRSIGFQVSDISAMWFFQTMIQFVVSMVIGFPIGRIVAQITLDDMSGSGTEFQFVNTPRLYLITIGIVLFYILISHLRAIIIIKKWNLAENVKEKD